MSNTDYFQDLLDRQAAAPRKNVLVVEGSTDVRFLNIVLDHAEFKKENPLARWIIGPAGGKDNVLRFIDRRPEWHGLVDRDALNDAELRVLRSEYRHLHILPRFCLESYLIEPDSLYAALLNQGTLPYHVTKKELSDRLLAPLPHAVEHGALWRVVHPLYDGLRERGFNGVLLDFNKNHTHQEIYDTLVEWNFYLEPVPLFNEFKRQIAIGQQMTQRKQLTQWVHGKSYWNYVVSPLLESLGDGRSRTKRMRSILKNLPLPDDLKDMLSFVRRPKY